MRKIINLYSLAFIISMTGIIWHYVWMSGDGWWYLAVGREIFSCKCLPEYNTLAFTGQWSEVLHQQWLPYLIFYGAYLHGGYFAVYAITALFITLSFVIIFSARKTQNSYFIVATFPILFGAIAFRNNFSVRSEALIYLLFSAEVSIISRWLKGKTCYLFLLPLLTMLWANSHSSLPLAFIYFALAFISSFMDRTESGDKETEEKKNFKEQTKFLLWGLVAFISTFMNPYTYKIYIDIYQRLTSESVNVIEIFRSPNFHDLQTLLQGIWLILLWLGLIKSPLKTRLFDLMVTGAMSMLFLNSQRYFIFAVLACSPIMAEHWGALTEKALQRKTLSIAVAVACAICGIWLLATPQYYKNVEANVAQASDKLMRSGFDGNVFNYYTWGGYLLWAHPEMKIFIDGRNNIYEKSGVFDDYRKVQRADPDWEEILDIYNIEAVFIPIWESNIYLELAQSERWKKVIMEGEAVIFVRADLLQTGE